MVNTKNLEKLVDLAASGFLNDQNDFAFLFGKDNEQSIHVSYFNDGGVHQFEILNFIGGKGVSHIRFDGEYSRTGSSIKVLDSSNTEQMERFLELLNRESFRNARKYRKERINVHPFWENTDIPSDGDYLVQVLLVNCKSYDRVEIFYGLKHDIEKDKEYQFDGITYQLLGELRFHDRQAAEKYLDNYKGYLSMPC